MSDALLRMRGVRKRFGGNRALVEATGAELLIHADDLPILRGASDHAPQFGCQTITPSPEPTRLLNHGDRIELGELRVAVHELAQ